jgi:hypothetical protein
MKTKNIVLLLTSLLMIMAFNSCDHFDDLNKNPNDPTDDMYDFNEAKLGGVLRYGVDFNMRDAKGDLAGAGHLHQRMKDLNVDYYSQYMHSQDNASTSNYIPNDGWNFEYWKGHYQWLTALNEVIEDAGEIESRINNAQIARIWRVYIQSMATDYFGPIPFPLSSEDNTGYMALDKQYEIFFKELDEAVHKMNPELHILTVSDPIYFGNFVKWQQFANSLRLRLALKVSEVNPALCKQQAEAAIAGPNGVMQSNANKTAVTGTESGWGNLYNYYMYQVSWGSKHVMTTTFEKVLTGIGGIAYNGTATTHPEKVDPRGVKYFDPSVNDNAWNGAYPGLPSGENTGIGQKHAFLSEVYILPNNTRDTEAFLYEETCFLMAEACERAFIPGGTGTAEEWYEKGVRESFRNWNADGVDAYLNSTEKNEWGTSAKYDDTAGAGNTKLEKIITQKYIANFPDIALQAWNDKRRLNLPAFDVPKYRDETAGYSQSNMNPLDPKNFIKRQVFPQNEVLINKADYDKGVQLLGAGGDKVSTNLWWDINANHCTFVP